MKQNIIELLKFITREGYDNSQWGICDFQVETKSHFGTLFNFTIENFIYVYWKADGHSTANFLFNNDPDYFLKLEPSADEFLFIFKY